MKLILVLLLSISLAGCGTVSPHNVDAKNGAWVANKADSGVGSFVQGGAIVSAEWVQNYNQGVEQYGNNLFFKHHLAKFEGVTLQSDGRYFATDQSLHNYSMFQYWRRKGQAQ